MESKQVPTGDAAAKVLQRLAELRRRQAGEVAAPAPRETVEIGAKPPLVVDLKTRLSAPQGMRTAIKADLDKLFDGVVMPAAAEVNAQPQLRRPQELSQAPSAPFGVRFTDGRLDFDTSSRSISLGGQRLNTAETTYLADALRFKFAERLTVGQADALSRALHCAQAWGSQAPAASAPLPAPGDAPPTQGSPLYEQLSGQGRVFSGTDFATRVSTFHPVGVDVHSEDYEMAKQARMREAGPAENERHLSVAANSGKFGVEFLVGDGKWVEPSDSGLRRVGTELFMTGGANSEAKRVFYFETEGPPRAADLTFSGTNQNLRIPVVLS